MVLNSLRNNGAPLQHERGAEASLTEKVTQQSDAEISAIDRRALSEVGRQFLVPDSIHDSVRECHAIGRLRKATVVEHRAQITLAKSAR